MRDVIGREIGRGLQYRVFRSSPTRVRKIPTTTVEKKTLLCRWGITRPADVRVWLRDADRSLHRSIPTIRKIFVDRDTTLIGHATFTDNFVVEQDFILTLEQYFQRHTVRENQRVIDLYIQSVIDGWRLGFCDTVFNFTINSGFQRGRVVFLDLGEFSFVKQRARRIVRSEFWLEQNSFQRLSPDLRLYARKRLRQRLTMARLEREWKAER